MPATSAKLAGLQSKIWSGSIPLEVRLAASDCRTYDESEPYLIQLPRTSYLAFLLNRLHAFVSSDLINPEVRPHDAWFSFEDVPLKWHYPAGLLFDILSGAEPVDLDRSADAGPSASHDPNGEVSKSSPLPWRLTVHYTDYPDDQLIRLDAEGRALLDSYINSVKEADYIRNGTARTVMSLSKEDSDNLWHSVQTHDLALFNSVNNKLLYPPGLELRHVPMKIYLPTAAGPPESETITEETKQVSHIRVVQSLVPLQLASKQPQTVGTALNTILPTIFPSRRNPLLAHPVLHGAVLPMGAHLEDLGRAASYPDGFLHVAVVMLG